MRTTVILAAFLALSACGGGGSNSSGGEPGPTPFAGKYEGQIQVTVSSGGTSVTQEYPATMEISTNGAVMADLEAAVDPDIVCRAPVEQVFINGDQVPFNVSGTCFTPGVGTCTISTTGSVVLSGNTAIGQSTGTADCSSGVSSAVRYEVGLRRI